VVTSERIGGLNRGTGNTGRGVQSRAAAGMAQRYAETLFAHVLLCHEHYYFGLH
jgi:hypothetical protein